MMTLFHGQRPVNRTLALSDAPQVKQYTDAYRPQTLAEVVGQDEVTTPLGAFLQAPYSTAMLFSGPTGAGKTSTAMALVNDLGVDTRSNFFHLKSGEMDGENAEWVLGTLRLVAFGGGWRVILVDEADMATPKARQLWLSKLEDLPAHTVVIWTTNHREKFDQRTLDRFAHDYTFKASGPATLAAAQGLCDSIWEAETGGTDGPDVATLPNVLVNGEVSCRRVASAMQSLIQRGDYRPVPIPPAILPTPEATMSAMGIAPVCGGAPEPESPPSEVFSGPAPAPYVPLRDRMRDLQDRYLELPWVKDIIARLGETQPVATGVSALQLRTLIVPELEPALRAALAEHEAIGNRPVELPAPAPAPEPVKPTRKRRTKAEMDRDARRQHIGHALKSGNNHATFDDLQPGTMFAVHYPDRTELYTVATNRDSLIGVAIGTDAAHGAHMVWGLQDDDLASYFERGVTLPPQRPAPTAPESPQSDPEPETTDHTSAQPIAPQTPSQSDATPRGGFSGVDLPEFNHEVYRGKVAVGDRLHCRGERDTNIFVVSQTSPVHVRMLTWGTPGHEQPLLPIHRERLLMIERNGLAMWIRGMDPAPTPPAPIALPPISGGAPEPLEESRAVRQIRRLREELEALDPHHSALAIADRFLSSPETCSRGETASALADAIAELEESPPDEDGPGGPDGSPLEPSRELVPITPASTPLEGFSGTIPSAEQRRDSLYASFISGLKPSTRRAYRADLADFARWMMAPSPEVAASSLFALDPGGANFAVLQYRADLVKRELSPSTVARRLAALRSLGQLARLLGLVTWSIEVDGPKATAYRDTSGPGRQAIADLKAVATQDDDPARGFRDRAIVDLGHDLGLRRSEIVGLDLEHVDQVGGNPIAVWILGKGQGDRKRLTLPAATAATLRDWIGNRGNAPGALFHRLDAGLEAAGPGRLTGEAVRLILLKLGRRAGIDRPVRPHGLRHAGITRAYEVTKDPLATQKFARHGRFDTTTRYIDNVEDTAGRVASLVAGG